MRNSEELLQTAKMNTLGLGDSGKGKTYFAGTICEHGKPYFIDAEGGLVTALKKGRQFDYEIVNTWSEFKRELEWYYKNYEAKGYTHLVIDSITRLQSYLADEIKPDGKLQIQDWGVVLHSLKKVINSLTKSCPTSLHMTAMAMESKDELSGAIKIYPNIQGSFKYDLAGYFDVVMYHDCGTKKGVQSYWVQTEGDTRVTARNRFNELKKLDKYSINNYSILADILGA